MNPVFFFLMRGNMNELNNANSEMLCRIAYIGCVHISLCVCLYIFMTPLMFLSAPFLFVNLIYVQLVFYSDLVWLIINVWHLHLVGNNKTFLKLFVVQWINLSNASKTWSSSLEIQYFNNKIIPIRSAKKKKSTQKCNKSIVTFAAFCRLRGRMTHRVVHGVGCEDVEESLLPEDTNHNYHKRLQIIQSSEPGS